MVALIHRAQPCVFRARAPYITPIQTRNQYDPWGFSGVGGAKGGLPGGRVERTRGQGTPDSLCDPPLFWFPRGNGIGKSFGFQLIARWEPFKIIGFVFNVPRVLGLVLACRTYCGKFNDGLIKITLGRRYNKSSRYLLNGCERQKIENIGHLRRRPSSSLEQVLADKIGRN